MEAEISISELTESDVSRLALLMCRHGASIAGVRSEKGFRKLLFSALSDLDLTVIVARDGHRPVGSVFVVTDWNAFKRRFPRRFPSLALEALRNRSRPVDVSAGLTPLANGDDVPYIPQNKSQATWNDSSPTIAKSIYILVDPSYRGQRIAQRMHESLIPVLLSKGVERLDAHMATWNSSIIKVHLREGWKVSRDEHGLFSTLDIQSKGSED